MRVLGVALVLLCPLLPVAAGAAAPAGAAPLAHGCVSGGFLRARIRGALVRDLAWGSAQLDCAGDVRPDGSGVRLSFAGPPLRGHRLRLVFGIRGVREGASGRELPTNLTVIEEGGRIFATQGEDRCTVDELRQERAGRRGSPAGAGGRRDDAGARIWRVIARGFCIGPANPLGGGSGIIVSRFDFSGAVSFTGPRRASAQ